MAARVDPRHVRARHQSMHHFVANAPWDGGAVLARGPRLGAGGRWPGTARWPRGSWMTPGTPRRVGTRSGWPASTAAPWANRTNCQVAVSVSLANDAVSLPVAYRLYLPESWAQDRRRAGPRGCRKTVTFQPEVAARPEPRSSRCRPRGCRRRRSWRMPATAISDRVSRRPDRARACRTWSGSKEDTTVWRPGQARPWPPKPRRGGRGRPSIARATDRARISPP